ncbi:hypothetical protein GOODEAATRI_000065 [Goodea atripinnis]|uniref:Uncharacterized protein n=1 Tax=Goodea atripinnis TaxID=208336 RepID=A0ABV0PJF6_9TELE
MFEIISHYSRFCTAEILQANDSLTHVINLYKQQVKGEIVNGNTTNATKPAGTALLDLSGLDTSPQSPPSFPEFPTPTDRLNAPSQETGISLLDDELMSLGNGLKMIRVCSVGVFKAIISRSAAHLSSSRDKQQSKPTLRDLQSKSGTNASTHPVVPFVSGHPAPNLGGTLLDKSPTHSEAPSPEVTLANEKFQLQYRLTFSMGEQEHNESGSVEQFPNSEKEQSASMRLTLCPLVTLYHLSWVLLSIVGT